MLFMQREKIFKCCVFSVFTQTHTKKSIVNLYQKELLGFFQKASKCGISYVLNW